MVKWQRSSFLGRRTMITGAFMALMCLFLSTLFLMYAGSKEADNALAKEIAAFSRVVPLIRQGPLPSVLPDEDDAAIQVLDAQGKPVAASAQLVGKPPIATFRPDDGATRSVRVLCPPAGLTGCQTVAAYNIFQPDSIWRLYVATPTVPWYGNSTAVLLAIGTSLLVSAVVTGWAYRDIANAVAPVTAIRRELSDITASQLDRRVPVPDNHTYEEIKVLAETVNDTLDRLEGAYEQLRRFTSDASHDLRSPITAMRTQLDEALMFPEETDWPTTATAVLAGVDRLQAIVTDLLALARLDAGAPLSREPTDLGRLAGAELDQRAYRAMIVRRLQPDVRVDCDRLRVTRVLVNLLDNAERHTTSQITVTVRAEDGSAVLEVLDDGAGVAPGDRKRVFERFTRLDAARDRDSGGTGLGLAIAREIAQAHGGTLRIEDSDRGARFVLRLPLSKGVAVTPQPAPEQPRTWTILLDRQAGHPKTDRAATVFTQIRRLVTGGVFSRHR
ncbi:sensor histidine kinase [Acrocarpospora catenulata]|uniref:sensor histidine kinase n=1 Tax=Acrocarpospora catenulata TaxID=2836182 RepID=UPI001BD9627F|nr:HAMP domain-containing sensor histidine kinase [Acrocarpospora catenulata]